MLDLLGGMSLGQFGLYCFALVFCNSLAMAAFAIHASPRWTKFDVIWFELPYPFMWLFVESLLVVQILAALIAIPVGILFLGMLAFRRASWKSLRGVRRMALVLAVCFAPLLYYLDAFLYSNWSLRLLDPASWESIWPILFVLSEYLTSQLLLDYMPSTVAFLVVQIVACMLGLKMARGSVANRKRWIGATVGFLTVAAGFCLAEYRHPTYWKAKCPQPFYLTGTNDSFSFSGFRKAEPFEEELTALVLNQQSGLRRVYDAHNRLEIRTPPNRPLPDIIIIIVESWRFDALQPATESSPASAPNILSFANDSLVGTMHFSAGNNSKFGWYALMYGLHPTLSYLGLPSSEPALTRLLHQAGYLTAFVGSWGLRTLHMDEFVNERTFDRFVLRDTEWPKSGDRADAWTVDRTRALLEETPEPVAVVVQIVGTHFIYNDAIRTNDRQLMVNRYRKAVRVMDRCIAPLLRRDAIVVVVGDHGEAFLDDGETIRHGGNPSFVTTRTPLVFHVPTRGAARLDGVTSHLDILPTLIDVLDLDVEHRVLAGRSLYGKRTDMQPCFLVGSAYKHLLFDSASPDELYLCRLNVADGIVRYLGRVDEHVRPYQPGRRNSHNQHRFAVLLKRWLNETVGTNAPQPTGDLREEIRKLLADRNPKIRKTAVNLLPLLPEMDSLAVGDMQDMVRKMLADGDPEIREAAVKRLHELGSRALDYQSDVVSLLRDESRAVREAARATLRLLNEMRRAPVD